MMVCSIMKSFPYIMMSLYYANIIMLLYDVITLCYSLYYTNIITLCYVMSLHYVKIIALHKDAIVLC